MRIKPILLLILTLLSSASMAEEKTKLMTIAGGCFWCMEPIFESTDGVVKATVGYGGGTTANPTYEKMGDHYELAQIEYYPSKVSFNELLKIYWYNIDAFDVGGQFYDRGKQYETAIFYHDTEQKLAAEQSKAEIEKKQGKKVATKILPFTNFYIAEDYHQDYYKKNASHYNAYKNGSGREEKLKNIWK